MGHCAGTGYALLHCHIMPHADEGCILKTQILAKT
jgi:FtsP/CotA-like multicopper oxidase with cupredoxin domain